MYVHVADLIKLGRAALIPPCPPHTTRSKRPIPGGGGGVHCRPPSTQPHREVGGGWGGGLVAAKGTRGRGRVCVAGPVPFMAETDAKPSDLPSHV